MIRPTCSSNLLAKRFRLISLFLVAFVPFLRAVAEDQPKYLTWQQLSSLPPIPGLNQSLGFAGAYSGVHNDALIVAGGTNFVDGKKPWEGGKKVWYNTVYVLEKKSEQRYEWVTSSATLPHSLAYGASVSTSEGVICIGGADEQAYHRAVFALRWNRQSRTVETEPLPDLPVPLAYTSAVLLGTKIYVAGGEESPQTHLSTSYFFSLDLAKKGDKTAFRWEKLATWPGPARIMPVLTAQNDGETNCLYLFSGRSIGANGTDALLSDGYSYNPKLRSWKKLADIQLPQETAARCVVGAPAIPFGLNHILVFGGADNEVHRRFRVVLKAFNQEKPGSSKDSLRQELNRIAASHPGFSRDILAYHTITGQWLKAGELPEPGPVLTQATRWGDAIVVPSGEINPANRSAKIWRADPITITSSVLGWLDYGVILLYFLGVVYIGFRYSKGTKNTNDYYKAGGRIPGWVSGVAIFGTLMSSITFLTTPAKTYAGNWLYFLPTLSSLVVAPIIVYFIVPVYVRLNITTAYEYLEKRFSPLLRTIGSLSFLAFRVAKIGVILLLPSLTISAITGIDVVTCVTVIGLFSTVYCALGGIEAVVWTEVLQVFVLLLGALLSFIIIAFRIDGGVAGIFATSQDLGKLDFIKWDAGFVELTVFIVISYWIGGGLAPYTSDQAVIQKYLTTKDEKSAAKGVWLNAFIIATSSFLFFAIGTALFAFYKAYPTHLNPSLATPESIFPWFIVNELPVGIKGMVIAGVFAAAMSSLNTSMNSMSSAVVIDYLQYRKGIRPRTQLFLAKGVSALFGLIGTGLAVMMFIWEVGSLWDLMRKLIGLLTGGLAGLFLLGIFTKRANAQGALIGFIVSSAVQYFISNSSIHFMVYSLTGIASCFITGYLASLLFPKPTQSLAGLTTYTMKEIKPEPEKRPSLENR